MSEELFIPIWEWGRDPALVPENPDCLRLIWLGSYDELPDIGKLLSVFSRIFTKNDQHLSNQPLYIFKNSIFYHVLRLTLVIGPTVVNLWTDFPEEEISGLGSLKKGFDLNGVMLCETPVARVNCSLNSTFVRPLANKIISEF